MSYEKRDAPPAVIGIGAGCIALSIISALLVALWIGRIRVGGLEVLPHRQTAFIDGYRQEPEVVEAWREASADFNRRLHGYGWVDRKSGIVRIPIERAMQLVADGARPAPFPAGARQLGPPPPPP